MQDYLERDIAPSLLHALEAMPVVVLTGLRQSGKSTLLQHQAQLKGRRFISMDDFEQIEAVRRNPDAFLQVSGGLTIDEVQRAPELLVAIKRAVDKDRRPGRFLLSGSANLSLLAGVSESLAGRALYLALHPFSRREISGAADETPWLRRCFESGHPPGGPSGTIRLEEILQGGMPPVCLGLAPDPALWFKGYEQSYLERDVRSLRQIADLASFRNLLKLSALRTGQILNRSKLARDAKLNSSTAKAYLGVLEASFVLRLLPPHLGNRANRLIKSPKLYLEDSGLACHLAGLSTASELGADALRGPLFETYVAQNLSGVLASRWPEAALSYWHLQGRHEVDFVVERGRDTLAIEVKAGSRWSPRDLSGLKAFLDASPRCKAGILAYNGEEAVSLGDRLWAVPVSRVIS